MISFVTIEGKDIIVTLHPAAHEKVNLAAVFPYARMNAGWFLAADEQKNRTFSWKGLEELLLLWSDCWLEVVSHRFLKKHLKKKLLSPNVIHQQTFALILIVFFCLQMPRLVFILFRNSFGKNNSEVIDMSVSSTMGNFDQKQGQETNKYTLGIFVGRKGERWIFFHELIESFLAGHLQVPHNSICFIHTW